MIKYITYNSTIWLIPAFLILMAPDGQSQYRHIGTPIIKSFEGFFVKENISDLCINESGEIFVSHDEGLSLLLGQNVLEIPGLKGEGIRFIDTMANRTYYLGNLSFGYIETGTGGPVQHTILSKDTALLSSASFLASSPQSIYILKDTLLLRYDSEINQFITDVHGVTGLYKSGNEIFYYRKGEGIYSENHEKIAGSDLLEMHTLTNVISLRTGHKIIVTREDGLYISDGTEMRRWSRETYDIFRNDKIDEGVLWNRFLVILSNNKIYILNDKGKVVKYFSLDQEGGEIKHIVQDRDNNLLVFSNRTVYKCFLNIQASTLCPADCLRVNDVEIYNERLYLATPNGLYYTPWSEEGPYELYPRYYLVPNSRGYVHSLDIVRNDLLMGHEDGAFHIYDNRAIKLSGSGNTYAFIPFRYDNTVLACSDKGIDLFRKSGYRLLFDRTLTGLSEPVIQLEEYNDTLFILSPVAGISKVWVYPNMKAAQKIYNDTTLWPQDVINISKIANHLYVSSPRKIYKYEIETGGFNSHNTLSEILDLKQNVLFLKEDINENIWYISDNNPGLLELTEDSISETFNHYPLEEYVPMTNDLEVNSIFSYNNQNTFISTSSGALYINYTDLKKLQSSPQLLRALSVNDSLLYIDPADITASLAFSSSQNNVAFYFQKSENRERKYSYFLSDSDETKWSAWQIEGFASFSDLPPGDYTFSVKSTENDNGTLLISSVDFSISQPPFSFPYEYLIYALAVCGLLAIILLLPSFIYRKRLKKLQRETTDMKTLLVTRTHKENPPDYLPKESLGLEKSIAVLKAKSQSAKKLAIALSKTKLSGAKKDPSVYQRLLKTVTPDYNDWEEFFYQFEQQCPVFLSNLIADYPNLSPEEQKLCIFYRCELSDEDIILLNQMDTNDFRSMKKSILEKLEVSTETSLRLLLRNY